MKQVTIGPSEMKGRVQFRIKKSDVPTVVSGHWLLMILNFNNIDF